MALVWRENFLFQSLLKPLGGGPGWVGRWRSQSCKPVGLREPGGFAPNLGEFSPWPRRGLAQGSRYTPGIPALPKRGTFLCCHQQECPCPGVQHSLTPWLSALLHHSFPLSPGEPQPGATTPRHLPSLLHSGIPKSPSAPCCPPTDPTLPFPTGRTPPGDPPVHFAADSERREHELPLASSGH